MTFLKVDLHTHILPKQWPDLSRKYGTGGWAQLDHFEPDRARMMLNGKNFRTIECNCWHPPARLQDMSATSSHIQVLSTVPVMFNYHQNPEHTLDLARYLNDHIAQCCAEDPKHFVGLGTVPMQAPELAAAEVRRCVEELGLKGIQIGSHINQWNLDAQELDVLWKTCEELDCAIFVHPWDMDNKGRMEKFWFPWLIGMASILLMKPCETTVSICSLLMGGVFDRFPNLKVCFAHGGGSFPATLGRINHGFEARPDLCATKTKRSPASYVKEGKIKVDSLVHDEDTLRFLIIKMGIDNIMLGSDYPFPLGDLEVGKMIIDGCEWLSVEDKNKILSTNAVRFLGIEDVVTKYWSEL
ncbi:hypothetical protein BZG36_05047 [Bifiguratus adelaidae]|uniref:2-amino-3-carboxymuconate-6-semialdehyde decarboxylase n=1 Tax=Bifiguratus adelaidae TaxID=1938954 RepID=A0A261XYP8_9FUNG|nr:hypothetical protein BZG36_05047 [Bifiguratus adelaidae]